MTRTMFELRASQESGWCILQALHVVLILCALKKKKIIIIILCSLAVHEETEKEAHWQDRCHQEESSCGHPGSGERKMEGGRNRDEPSGGSEEVWI